MRTSAFWLFVLSISCGVAWRKWPRLGVRARTTPSVRSLDPLRCGCARVQKSVPLSIVAIFTPGVTAAQQAVILQAIAEWEGVIEHAGQRINPYPITFKAGSLATVAKNETSYSLVNGTMLGSVITIDDDGSTPWFVDPTPGLNEEYDSSGNCIALSCTDDYDLLTFMRHEIGHALGWVGGFSIGGSFTNPLVSLLITGSTFDPGG